MGEGIGMTSFQKIPNIIILIVSVWLVTLTIYTINAKVTTNRESNWQYPKGVTGESILFDNWQAAATIWNGSSKPFSGKVLFYGKVEQSDGNSVLYPAGSIEISVNSWSQKTTGAVHLVSPILQIPLDSNSHGAWVHLNDVQIRILNSDGFSIFMEAER